MPDPDRLAKLQRRIVVRNGLEQSDVGSLDARVERWLSLDPPLMVPATPFSPASAECFFLYRDGHHYGCISLCQAIAEALVRHLCAKSAIPQKKWETNLRNLRKKGRVDDEFVKDASIVWARRNDFHHLNSTIPTDLAELSDLARAKIEALVRLEKQLFSAEFPGGVLTPDKPENWTQSGDGTTKVFLRGF
jgi:hypothetical protein